MKEYKFINYLFQIVGPLVLAGLILWWMYRGFDWDAFYHALEYDMNWTWMLLSMPFGITAQVFRAMRWKQSLEPLGEKPRLNTCIQAIFLSYAASLVIPRVGEVLRCGVLRRYDGVSFARSVGTVVTERLIDSLFILLLAGVAVLVQMPVFLDFFQQTGVSVTSILAGFSAAGYWVTFACLAICVVFFLWILRKLSFFQKTKKMMNNLKEGILSLRQVQHISVFCLNTIGIWLSYYLHFYLTFYCFATTSNLGAMAALAAFVVGCFAVLVPTPNGAGPWHFAVKTVLILYGVQAQEGVIFVLVVHTLQTLLVLLLGLYALGALQCIRPRKADDA